LRRQRETIVKTRRDLSAQFGKATSARIQEIRAKHKDELAQISARAYEAGYEDGNDDPVSGELRTFGYRRASSGAVREFGGLDYDKVLDTLRLGRNTLLR
jgi:hypothetical protein